MRGQEIARERIPTSSFGVSAPDDRKSPDMFEHHLIGRVAQRAVVEHDDRRTDE